VNPLKALRGRIWRRLEPRIQGVVSARLDPVIARVREALTVAEQAKRQAAEAAEAVARLRAEVQATRAMDERLRATTAKANEAHRLATESARAVERVLQAEIELWQAIDTKPGG
jgi:uncharacterized coiled-coil DUF342 family protein